MRRRLDEIRTKDMFPYHFVDLFVKRVLPVSALSWLISIFAIAFARGGPMGMFAELIDGGGLYIVAMVLTLWVSIPPLIWMSLVGSRDWEDYAVQSYWGAAGLMALCQLMYLLLFPEDYGQVRLGTIISIPLHFVIFTLLIWPMAPWVRVPVKVVAGVTLAYGLFTFFG